MVVGGYWSSGLPYLKSSLKQKWDPDYVKDDSLHGVQLILNRIDISGLKVCASHMHINFRNRLGKFKKLSMQSGHSKEIISVGMQDVIQREGEALWDVEEQERWNAVLKGRTKNTRRYKPGTGEVLLMFCDQRGETVYLFPYYDRFKPILEPLLDQVGPLFS